jgi:hypothetical protein
MPTSSPSPATTEVRRSLLPVAVTAIAISAACGGESSDPDAVIDPGDDGDYTVDIRPDEFTSAIDNPFLPLLPGMRWRYEETDPEGEIETITVEVLDEHRRVMGVDTIVVHDVVAGPDGEVVEDTFDWYAQDRQGNVWYFGEDSTSFDGGTASSEGSWEAGRDGALPGIVMPARIEVSDIGYRQEYLPGEAEDMGQIIADHGSVSVPAGDFTDVVRTRDWTPLESDVIEEKTFARGVGLVHEVTVRGPGAPEEAVLVEYAGGR